MAKPASIADLVDETRSCCRKPTSTFWREISKTARGLKATTVDAHEKNRLWAIHAFADGTGLYLDAYRQMARGAFYEGWCTLENAEHAFARLGENPFIEELSVLVEDRARVVALWQSLFPYKFFASPGMRYKRWACSICGKQSTPVEPCGHVPNRVYAGQLCYRIIHEAEPLEVSIVTDPVQKYSVLQLDYDYSVVQYVLDHLNGPFHRWDGEWTYKRHPHHQFTDRDPEDACPCRSELRYRECCLPKNGVRLPHFQMVVDQGVTRRGTLEDQLILRAPAEHKSTEGERIFRVNLLRANPQVARGTQGSR